MNIKIKLVINVIFHFEIIAINALIKTFIQQWRASLSCLLEIIIQNTFIYVNFTLN
jgi:hypothetical protein